MSDKPGSAVFSTVRHGDPLTDGTGRGPERISVVVPVFNAENSLEELVRRILGSCDRSRRGVETVLVDDGSRDGSWAVICSLARRDERVRGLRLTRNYGQHNALLAGLRAARHPVVVTLDDDLQNPPEEIPVLLAALDDDHDVVYGVPEREGHGIFRRIASAATKIVLREAMGADTARSVGPFRAFRTSLREAFEAYRSPYVSIDVLLTWSTDRFVSVRVRHDPRRYGRSNYGPGRLVTHAVNMVTGFSTVPLEVASLLGFVLTAFGVIVLAFVVGRYLVSGAAVQGFTFLASLVAILSGAQLFMLGVIGEYLARMHFRSMDKPTYVVAGVTASTEDGTPPRSA